MSRAASGLDGNEVFFSSQNTLKKWVTFSSKDGGKESALTSIGVFSATFRRWRALIVARKGWTRRWWYRLGGLGLAKNSKRLPKK